MHLPVGELSLEGVRLDEALRPGLLTFLLVLDVDDLAVADRLGERRDEPLLLRSHVRLGRLRQLELTEGLLELAAHAIEGRVRVGGDHRADELERKANGARLERRQSRRQAERVAVQLLVDADGVAVELGVDRVATAAEIDEVQELQVLLELLLWNAETLDEFVRGNYRVASLAACGEQVGKQRLQHRESLGHDGTGRPLARNLAA